MKAFILGLALLAGGACGHSPTPPPVPPGDATCATACARMQQLDCAAGEPTPRGEPCTAVCENVVTGGIITWDLLCMSRATSCDQVDRCNP